MFSGIFSTSSITVLSRNIAFSFRRKRSVTLKNCGKGVCGRVSTLHPGPWCGAQDPLVGWGGDTPSPIHTPSKRLDIGARVECIFSACDPGYAVGEIRFFCCCTDDPVEKRFRVCDQPLLYSRIICLIVCFIHHDVSG